MRIISQDRTVDVIYDNVHLIAERCDFATDGWEDTNVLAYTSFDEVNAAALGRYSTEERAKEVLEEIRDHYDELKYSEFMGFENEVYVSNIYKMPEE